MITWLEVGNSEKRRGWVCPPPFLLFLPPTIKSVDLSNQMYIGKKQERKSCRVNISAASTLLFTFLHFLISLN
ncbi:hypothetical protein HMPREF0083_06012 [Aneurinibacillus aneurinilyticus ATCC 12856]|uniref:Uncharacterized protein n=1 Tax=Aneurinibacillus aneurinilyticus ATCC 12856 TaxID=649747 RepID=U1WPE3_ANEAE|nr:hypothetical protein HMPREF0083_06012 [Aneurinibacillus aneurinilyticus ATCC 12856]